MKSVLACRRDPVKLGIKTADGKWNDIAFRRHKRKCWKCKMISGDTKDIVFWLPKDTPTKKERWPFSKPM